MGSGSKKLRAKKKRALAANGATADKRDDDASPPKKPRAAAKKELSEEATKAAKKFALQADKHASGWKALKREDAAELVVRVAKETTMGYNRISQQVAKAIYDALPQRQRPRKLNSTSVPTLINRYLAGVPAAAFVVAGAPPKKKEEGFVEGTVDVRLLTDDTWRRYRNPTVAGEDTKYLGARAGLVKKALGRVSDPKDKYAEDRGFAVRPVTPAVRHATAANKVVRGYHRAHIAHVDRDWGCDRSRAADAGRAEEERKAKEALAAAAKEKKEADRKAQYDMFGLTYFEAPPLPDGATDADLEGLEDEDLEAMYGH